MKKRYGIPYQGSKSTIAPWVVENLPQANTLVDLFAGGCAITHAAIEAGKYAHVLANDLTDAPAIFKAATEGQFAGFSYVPTREEFYASDDDAIKLLYSFGNNRRAYLWSKELEPVKVAASRMISAPSEYERRMHYRTFIRELRAYIERNNKMPDSDRAHDGGLQGLQGLERLQGLEGLEGLEGLQISKQDYRDVDIPADSIVYADPPYRNTDCRAYKGFDFSVFDEWLSSVPFMVVISEYTAPTDCVEVASVIKTVTMAPNKTNKRAEKLFVQARFQDEYTERMYEQQEQQAIAF